MTDIPPSRYQVVERGRRLVVIDRASGVEVSHAPPAAAPVALSLPEKIRFDGGAVLTTHLFYDDKAPRTVTLDPRRASLLRSLKIAVPIVLLLYAGLALVQPLVLGLLIVAVQPKVRKAARARITAWLDTAWPDVRARDNG